MGDLGARLTAAVTGVIVAGGQATRLGGVAKGLLDIGGVRLIDRVASALSGVTSEVIVAASAPGADTWLSNVRAVGDILVGGGAAAGLHAAVRSTGSAILAVGWDMPFVSPALLRLILDRAHTGEFDAVVPAGGTPGALEPLCAWYAPAAANAIEANWTAGRRSLHDLLAGIRTHIVPQSAIATIGPPERLFFNVNTPDDLAAARSMLATA